MLPRTVASCVVAAAVAAGCARGSKEHEPVTPSTAAVSGDPASSGSFRSARYGFEWKLPSDWRFATADDVELPLEHPSHETVAALTESDNRMALLLVQVTEVYFIEKGAESKNLEEHALKELERAGAEKTGTSRIEVLGDDAARIDGHLELEGQRVPLSVVSFFRNRRRFMLTCYSSTDDSWSGCAGALSGLTIDDRPDVRGPNDQPRVLHLRAKEYGLEFDAPDDGWLATGPRTARGGLQLVWMWVKDGRQIDVQVLDHAGVGDRIDEADHASFAMESFREPGTVATQKKSTLSGLACTHIEVSLGNGKKQDAFLQKRGEILYGVLVTAPVRDQALLDRARAGIRITKPESAARR